MLPSSSQSRPPSPQQSQQSQQPQRNENEFDKGDDNINWAAALEELELQ